MAANLDGMRVLLVEDQMLVAMEMESLLEGLGCEVVEIASNLGRAVRSAREEAFDAAIVDVNLDGDIAWPVMKELQARDIPFALATGYGEWALPEALHHVPRLEKPVGRRGLQSVMMRLRTESLHGFAETK